LNNAKKRKVSKEFVEGGLANEEKLANLLVEWTPPFPTPMPIEASREIAALLTAPSKRELLANAMAASDMVMYLSKEIQSQPLKQYSFFSQVPKLRGIQFSNHSAAPDSYTPEMRVLSLFLREPINKAAWDRMKLTKPKSEALANGIAAKDPSVYLDTSSKAYDMSMDTKLLQMICSSSARVHKLLCRKKRLFEDSADLYSDEAAEVLAKQTNNQQGTVAIKSVAEHKNTIGAECAKSKQVFGIRLRDLQELVENNRSWFEEARYCQFSKKDKTKTMYDVCPELVIPATTIQERIVTLLPEDIPKLKARREGGILVSNSDLTLDPDEQFVHLGGKDVPGGLTLHGRLYRDGKIRRSYWALGEKRCQVWQTLPCHGRDEAPLSEVAPIPDGLPGEGEGVGEKEDRVWKTAELQAGDSIVLRKGISFVKVCDKDGPGFPLDSFASHFWGEETLDFLKSLVRHATAVQRDREIGDRTYYICTFNNNQHRVELGSGWQDSPFNQALQFVSGMAKNEPSRVHDAVMVFDSEAQPLRRKWCVFEAWRCTELELPLHLFCPEGEITRNSTSELAKEVLKCVQEIDLRTAQCSVKADADMIDEAIEEAKGGFTAVHAKLRTRVLDLMTFIGSLAVSIDPVTGKKVEEIELQVHGLAPPSIEGSLFPTNQIARAMCGETDRLDAAHSRHVLLVAPAGSGKSVFSRALVRHTVMHSKDIKGRHVLPVRVPLAELAKVVRAMRYDAKLIFKKAKLKLQAGQISEEQLAPIREAAQQPNIDNIFETWAEQTFLRDSHKVVSDDVHDRLLILDGFDEGGETKPDIFRWLRKYVKEHPRIMTLLTTRPSGLDQMAMSSGGQHRPKKAKIKLIDTEQNVVALDQAFPEGTYLKIQGLDPPYCSILSKRERLTLSKSRKQGSVILKPTQSLEMVDFITTCKAGSYVNLPLYSNTGKGALVDVLIRTEKSVRIKDRQQKIVTCEDLIVLTVTKSGTGYMVGSEARVLLSDIPRHDYQAVMAEIREHELRGTPQLEYADLTLLSKRLQRIQQKDEESESGETPEPSRAPGILFTVRDVTEVSTLTYRFNDTDAVVQLTRTDVTENSAVEEVLVREELVHELGFSDFEIDTISLENAAAIMRNVGGPPLRELTPEMLSPYPRALWERPLMANLLGQYVEVHGVSAMTTMNPALAELQILRFIADKLINQAAEVIAPTRHKDAVKKMYKELRTTLEVTSRRKVRNNVIFWGKEDLSRLILSPALRGNLRLFEPVEGGTHVKFYHNRILEVLAAESWHKNAAAFEQTITEIVQCQQIVQMGCEPLKFLAQAKLSEQKDPRQLYLDFVGATTTASPRQVVTTMPKWMPRDLDSLYLKITLRSDFPAEALVGVLPAKMAHLHLDFCGCILFDKNFEHLGHALPPQLKTLKLYTKRANKLTATAFCNLGISLPTTLQEFVLDAPRTEECCIADIADGFIAKLPPSIERLELNLSGWGVHDDVAESLVDKMNLPALKLLSLRIQRVPITAHGISKLCEGFPRHLRHLKLDFRLSLGVRGGEATGMAAMLPPTLETLRVTFNRFTNDNDLLSLVGRLPPSMRELELDFFRDRNITNKGMSDLGDLVAKMALERFSLNVTWCQAITDEGICHLCQSLPSNLRVMQMDFSNTKFGDACLETLGAALPSQLQKLELNLTRCFKVTDAGIAKLCVNIPGCLTEFALTLRGCKDIQGSALAGLGAGLPPKLEVFMLNCARCFAIGNDGLIGLGHALPASITNLELSFMKSAVSDDGLRGIGQGLPGGAQDIKLNFDDCCKVTDLGVKELCSRLPTNAQQENTLPLPLRLLSLSFKLCKDVTSTGLQAVVEHLNVPARAVRIDYMNKKLESDTL